MDILFVRHGESQANSEARLQGHLDSPLTERGKEQAARLAAWITSVGFCWDAAYVSPLLRARQTAEVVAATRRGPLPVVEPLLIELSAGVLQGLNQEQILEQYPAFVERKVTDLGDFAEYGGESYTAVQGRVEQLWQRLCELHRESAHRLLLVGHGGFHFQMVKRLVCEPVPRVCILKMGNCTATLVRVRERRGTYLGEVVWHVPVDLMGGGAAEGASSLFR